MSVSIHNTVTVFLVLFVYLDFVRSQSQPLTTKTEYVGCFANDFALSKPYNKLRFSWTWSDGLKGCEHRLTTHMAVQNSEAFFKFYNFIFCGNDLAERSTPLNSSMCKKCEERDEDKYCGGKDAVSVYKLLDKVPVSVLIATEDVGVIMIRDDIPRKPYLLARFDTKPTSLGYSYEDDELLVANNTHAMRFYYDIDTSKYTMITGEVPTCNGSILRAPAMDWVNKEVVYGCDSNRKLQAIDFVGDLYAKDILTHNHYFHDISYDPYQREVFFTNLGDKAFRHVLESRHTTDLTKKGVLTKGRTLSVDVDNKRLYVVGETSGTPSGQASLLSMNYDGSDSQIVFQGPELDGKNVKFDVYDGTVVWASYNNTKKRSIAYRCDLNSKNVCEPDNLRQILVSVKNLCDLKIYHPLRQAPLQSKVDSKPTAAGSPTKPSQEFGGKFGASCPPVEGKNVVCTYNGKQQSCEDVEVPPGTTATQRCKDIRNQLYLPESATLKCLDSGDWDYSQFYCTAECGIPSNNITVTELIINGEEAQRGEYPWQVALYMRKMPNDTLADSWQQLCGGTLISARLVLTAAHCLVYAKSKLQPPDIKVGLGKLFRDFYVKEPFSIIADVREVVIPRVYLGAKSSYAQDIALLHLREKVKFNDYIRPACIDWEQAISFTSGERAHVAGWGFTERNEPSEVLLTTKLDYLDLYTCLEKLTKKPVTQVHITYDKFCAQSVNGSQVWQGDSGGGMTAVKNGQHFLIGIVSARLEREFDYSMFTNIYSNEHFPWLERERIRLLTNT